MEPPPHFGSCRQRVPPPGCPSACEPRPAHGAPTHGAPALLSPSSFQLQHGLAPDVRQQQTPVLRARGLPGLRHRLLLPLRRRLHGERAAVRRRRYAASPSPSPSPSPSLSLSPSLCPRVPCPPAEQGARSAARAQAPPPPQLSQAGGDASSQPRSLLPVPRTGAPGRSVSPVPLPRRRATAARAPSAHCPRRGKRPGGAHAAWARRCQRPSFSCFSQAASLPLLPNLTVPMVIKPLQDLGGLASADACAGGHTGCPSPRPLGPSSPRAPEVAAWRWRGIRGAHS